MAVRVAKYVDMPAIVGVLRRAHARSVYAQTATFDEIEAKRLVTQCVQRHGHTNHGGTLVLVSEADSEVRGFIIGMLDYVYPCLDKLMVTDLFFICEPQAPPMDAVRMVNWLATWAESNANVIELHLGISDALGNWERIAHLYRHVGLEQSGAMFTKRFTR